MTDNAYKEVAKHIAQELFNALEDTFSQRISLDLKVIKRWFGFNIKDGFFSGYRNLTAHNNESKFVFDVLKDEESYHLGIDFDRQAVYATLGSGDVYSLYFQESSSW